mgnify:CR=1 FL=1
MSTSQAQIMQALGTGPYFTAASAIRSRINFIKEYMIATPAETLVLGISGGVDSSTLGRLAQLAVDELNDGLSPGDEVYHFIAVRLPYGVQADEDDAQAALDFIIPSNIFTVNIKPSVDALQHSIGAGVETGVSFGAKEDFIKGNDKARMRMMVQYNIAARFNGLVLGTDHAAEAITGFFTKHGDGACDLVPLAGLTKGNVRAMCEELGAPESIWGKPATADLEELQPQLLDEDSLGVSYENLDLFLVGETIDPQVSEKIIARYELTEHKRHGPVTPLDTWWKPNQRR